MIYLFILSISLSIITLVIEKTKRYYIYIPITAIIISFTITVLYPRVITPLFFEIEKLQNPALKEKITSMIKKTGIEIEDIFVIDSSRISNSVNAYMTGFGEERRIVLYDTLLKNDNDDEILSVIAHETCHYIEEHMLIGISLGIAGIFLVLPLMNMLSTFVGVNGLKGLVKPQTHSTFLILLALFVFISKPVKNTITRYIESRADAYSITLTEKPEAFIEIKKRIAIENRTYLLPNPVFIWYYYTHPPVLERIKRAEDSLLR